MNRINPLFTDIAREHLLVETLETRNADRLDFHEVSVQGIHTALTAAYEAGRRSAANADLLAAAELVISRWESGDLAEAVRMLDQAVAEAKAA